MKVLSKDELQLIRNLSPNTLRMLAEHVPFPSLFTQLADALESENPDDAIQQAAEELDGAIADASGQKAPSGWTNWGALLPRIGSMIAVGFIVLFASAFILGVAGTLHPPIWELTQSLAQPWIDRLVALLEPLLQRLPR